MSAAQRWFVTGCSSGLGREIAIYALAAGYRVVATARNASALAELSAEYGEALLPLELDVTDESQASSAVSNAVATFGGVDVLVNNAGYCYLAAVEEAQWTEIRQMFDVNLFGAIALIQKVLPHMRAQRAGLVINISSGLGLVGAPSTGFYSAAKFALEGLTESLIHEVAPLGIRAMLVEPGPIRTDFSGRSMRIEPDLIDDYSGTAAVGKAIMQCPHEGDLADPARCAKEIVNAAGREFPPTRLPLGAHVIKPAEDKWLQLFTEFSKLRETAQSVFVDDCGH